MVHSTLVRAGQEEDFQQVAMWQPGEGGYICIFTPVCGRDAGTWADD